jgi:hypothetical protein
MPALKCIVGGGGDAGVELHSRGGRWVGLCPFHPENTPSFFIFPDNRFKCFSCHEHGDVVDFLQRLHGLDFQSVLRKLGIDRKPTTKAEKKQIAEAIKKQARRRELLNFYQRWQRAAIHTYSVLLRATYQALDHLTPENLDEYGDILQPLSTWTYYLDILTYGDDREKFELFKQHRKNKTVLLKRRNLFKPGFDFDEYLKNLE